jgi:hypothetical protein
MLSGSPFAMEVADYLFVARCAPRGNVSRALMVFAPAPFDVP